MSVKMTELYFANMKEQLRGAVARDDQAAVDKILDEATQVVDDLYEKMPADPPIRR